MKTSNIKLDKRPVLTGLIFNLVSTKVLQHLTDKKQQSADLLFFVIFFYFFTLCPIYSHIGLWYTFLSLFLCSNSQHFPFPAGFSGNHSVERPGESMGGGESENGFHFQNKSWFCSC